MENQKQNSAEKVVSIGQVVMSGVMLALQIAGLFRKVSKV